ncbi:hypothetical protein HK101_011277 [Irineochytrium annulatum]|nr:hypothetical protein HK101_011277 [Irineochytrium annulatum]
MGSLVSMGLSGVVPDLTGTVIRNLNLENNTLTAFSPPVDGIVLPTSLTKLNLLGSGISGAIPPLANLNNTLNTCILSAQMCFADGEVVPAVCTGVVTTCPASTTSSLATTSSVTTSSPTDATAPALGATKEIPTDPAPAFSSNAVTTSSHDSNFTSSASSAPTPRAALIAISTSISLIIILIATVFLLLHLRRRAAARTAAAARSVRTFKRKSSPPSSPTTLTTPPAAAAAPHSWRFQPTVNAGTASIVTSADKASRVLGVAPASSMDDTVGTSSNGSSMGRGSLGSSVSGLTPLLGSGMAATSSSSRIGTAPRSPRGSMGRTIRPEVYVPYVHPTSAAPVVPPKDPSATSNIGASLNRAATSPISSSPTATTSMTPATTTTSTLPPRPGSTVTPPQILTPPVRRKSLSNLLNPPQPSPIPEPLPAFQPLALALPTLTLEGRRSEDAAWRRAEEDDNDDDDARRRREIEDAVWRAGEEHARRMREQAERERREVVQQWTAGVEERSEVNRVEAERAAEEALRLEAGRRAAEVVEVVEGGEDERGRAAERDVAKPRAPARTHSRHVKVPSALLAAAGEAMPMPLVLPGADEAARPPPAGERRESVGSLQSHSDLFGLYQSRKRGE